jgi:hypothetical protein
MLSLDWCLSTYKRANLEVWPLYLSPQQVLIHGDLTAINSFSTSLYLETHCCFVGWHSNLFKFLFMLFFFFFLCDSFSCMVDSGTQKRVIVGWFGAKSPFAWCPNYATFHSCREIYPMASFIFRAAKFFKFTCAIVYISSSIFSMHKLLAGLEFCHEGISVLHICFAFFFDCL